MTKFKYKNKCKALFRKAKKLGVELIFSPEYFNHSRLNCLWYGGELAKIKVSDTLTIEISIYGDVYAWLLDENGDELARVKDKSNNGSFTDWMLPHIKTDKQLEKAICNGRLILDNNNWVEYDGLVNEGKIEKSDTEITWSFIDLGLICDNILDDDILVAIDEALDSIDRIRVEILGVAEEDYGIKVGVV